MRYRGSDKPLPEIARELNVDAVLDGSTLRSGDQVRITAHLIQAATDSQLWSERYDRNLHDILTLQGEIATAIAREIKVKLTPQEQTRLARARTVDPKVYEAYLRGTFYLNQGTPESIRRGLKHLRQAVEKDPADPLAYAGLALGYSQIASHGPWAPEEAFTLAKGAAIQALQLDETLAEAHAALAQIRLYRDWYWTGAEQAFQRALELNPNLPQARAHYAMYLCLYGRYDEAVAEIERAHQVDPLNPCWRHGSGMSTGVRGNTTKRLRHSRRYSKLTPISHGLFECWGSLMTVRGCMRRPLRCTKRRLPRNPDMKAALAYSYALAGRRDEARKIAAEVEKGDSWNKQKKTRRNLYRSRGNR